MEFENDQKMQSSRGHRKGKSSISFQESKDVGHFIYQGS